MISIIIVPDNLWQKIAYNVSYILFELNLCFLNVFFFSDNRDYFFILILVWGEKYVCTGQIPYLKWIVIRYEYL